jgi:hypothetical protein
MKSPFVFFQKDDILFNANKRQCNSCVDNNNARLYFSRSSTNTVGGIQTPSCIARCTESGIHIVSLTRRTSSSADAIGAYVITTGAISAGCSGVGLTIGIGDGWGRGHAARS